MQGQPFSRRRFFESMAGVAGVSALMLAATGCQGVQQALGPQSALLECVGEKAEEGVRLRSLLGFAERLRGSDEGVDLARVAIELLHPERLDVIEFFLVDQCDRVVSKRHGPHIVDDQCKRSVLSAES